MHVYVRFTGTRPGSLWYQAEGTRRYAFGQNPTHYQQAIPATEWPALKAHFGAWLLEMPVDRLYQPMALHTLVATADLPALTFADKEALIGAGLETLGMVLAEAPARVAETLGDRAENVTRAIGEYVGYHDAAIKEPVLPAEGAPATLTTTGTQPAQTSAKKRKRR